MKIISEREWDGGVKGQEITVQLPTTDRLVVQFLSEDGEVIDCEVTLQHDEQSRVEIEVIDGNVVLYS